MVAELPLDPDVRARLAELFRRVPRVDCGIDAVLWGPAGRALVDDATRPQAAALAIGPFWYLTGNPALPAAPALLDRIPLQPRHEVSVFIEPAQRRQGIATAVAGALVRESLARGLRPGWDAANPESCLLAERLGYVRTGTYLAQFVRG